MPVRPSSPAQINTGAFLIRICSKSSTPTARGPEEPTRASNSQNKSSTRRHYIGGRWIASHVAGQPTLSTRRGGADRLVWAPADTDPAVAAARVRSELVGPVESVPLVEKRARSTFAGCRNGARFRPRWARPSTCPVWQGRPWQYNHQLPAVMETFPFSQPLGITRRNDRILLHRSAYGMTAVELAESQWAEVCPRAWRRPWCEALGVAALCPISGRILDEIGFRPGFTGACDWPGRGRGFWASRLGYESLTGSTTRPRGDADPPAISGGVAGTGRHGAIYFDVRTRAWHAGAPVLPDIGQSCNAPTRRLVQRRGYADVV